MKAGADARPPDTWPAKLRDGFAGLPPAGRVWVALSGGLDSSFLLAATALWSQHQAQALPVQAIHVHHGMQDDADAWAQHCRKLCEQLELPLRVRRIRVDNNGEGLEMAARQARYAVFAGLLRPGDVLLLGHHLDDQAETVLYRLIRGSGVRGLAGMPRQRPLGQGSLYRPLLELPREQIEAWAARWHIQGCQDPSNRDTRFDRNFLRHEILPLLRSRWPGVEQAFGRAARHCRESEELLESLAREDLENLCSVDGEALELAPLLALPLGRQTLVLRHWLRNLGVSPPGQARLLSGLDALAQAQEDRQPCLAWADYQIRRFQGRLYLLTGSDLQTPPDALDWPLAETRDWAGGELVAQPCRGTGLQLPQDRLRVTRRRGGERIMVAGQRRALKQWLREQGVSPWQRQQLPLFWLDDELVAIADLWRDPRFEAGPGQPGWRIGWRRKGSNEADLDAVFD